MPAHSVAPALPRLERSVKKLLTDKGLKALKSAPTGERYMLWDAVVPSFGVRITDKGHISFVIQRRLDGRMLRRTLGDYPLLSLENARILAREALENITRGVDPKARQETLRRAKEEARQNNFEFAEQFIFRHVSKLKTGKLTEQVIRKHLISRFGKKPLADITRRNVIELLDDLPRPTARRMFVHLSQIFHWAMSRDIVQASPCERIKITEIVGPRAIRQRILTDSEIRVFWDGAGELGYPLTPYVRLLLLTAQRRSEVAGISWPEIDLSKKLWTIPPERMKSGSAHVVPLAPEALKIIESLPCFNRGPYLFSSSGGETPITGFANIKNRLDQCCDLKDFRLHDLRRTARTHFSMIPVSDLVRELAIAHAKPGLHRVYDQYAYVNERRFLLEQWEARCAALLNTALQRIPLRLPAGVSST
jgi:integrase